MKSSLSRKKYKALMLDVDGTLVKFSTQEALPTKRVKESVKKAEKFLAVGLATSRPYPYSSHLISDLGLTSPCILTSGAQIYDPVGKKIVYEKLMDPSSIGKIYEIVGKYDLKVLDDGRGEKGDLKQEDVEKPTQFWLEVPDQKEVEIILKDLSEIPSVSVHKLISRFDGRIEIIIGHTQATKQHGIQKVAEILGIKTSEIIGVGDGYNDFPLLMACGLKIAMGNAVPDLKEIADYIAPSIEDDGVADIIERFIL